MRTRLRTRSRIRTRRRRRTRSALYGLLAGLLMLGAGLLGTGLLSATPAAAADNGTWGVFPTPPAGAAMTDRAYFFHQGEAGSTVTDSATILNSSDKELTFQVFATDAVNTPVGGAFALLPVETGPKDVGTWIALPPQTATTVTVPPKGRKDIPFTVKVPADATPGDHVGGIVALNTAVEGVQKEGKVQVGVKRSVGARLYFRVPGPVTPGLSVEDVKVDRAAPLLPWVKKARAKVTYTLVNRGNVVVEPKVRVSAEGLFGRTVLDRPARELKLVLLPGQRIVLAEDWADAPQLDRVTVDITAGAAAYPDLSAGSAAAFLAVPWPALGAVLVLAGAAIAWWVLRRRRRTGAEDAEPTPDLAEAR
ncbi:WxL protein peptidoglycan domain-containing protein [Streptomyces sp. NPDC060028]|uniref:WxL protein peptidoglycan domain-containing protein n=1 Tax=Streptomyces sp. NPDC060028 TaxID=3347041 RepID=UPI0036CBAF83